MRVIDGGSVQLGKPVIMRAEWLAGYTEPPTFAVHEEANFLRKLWRRLGSNWHPMNPFRAYTPVPGISLSRQPWIAGVSDVTRQTGYYFRDHMMHTSGSITVSGATAWTRTETCIWNGFDLTLPSGFGISIPAEAGSTIVVTGVGASKDPRLRVEMLTPWAKGELNLLHHVRLLVTERLEQLAARGVEALIEPNDNALIEAADGYLTTDSPWRPVLAPDSREIVVDDLQSGQVNVVIPQGAAEVPCRTAYALRLVNVENPDDFVISSIVLLDSDGDSLRVQG